MFDTFKQDWKDTKPAQRWAYIGVLAVGLTAIGAHSLLKRNAESESGVDPAQAGQGGASDAPTAAAFHERSALPTSQRNQGLEDMQLSVQRLQEQLDKLAKAQDAQRSAAAVGIGSGGAGSSNSSPAGGAGGQGANVDLDSMIPSPTFPEGASRQSGVRGSGGVAGGGAAAQDGAASSPSPEAGHMKVWADDSASESAELPKVATAQQDDSFVVPVNAALDGVLLSGFNARPTGSVAGAVGNNAQTSANDVGAPFVTRLKGDAILPNGWHIPLLGDCFLGGSGIAVLAAERAYAISSELSCIDPSGEVWEAPIKAYALDVDGTLGLAGHVVSKQGSLLMQAALTGAAAGLGTALSPTSIPTYSSNGSNGSTAGYQYPNLGALGYTAVGQGVSSAAQQLSRFYLQYASEVFPVIEVVSGTRVTWVLRQSVELHRRTGGRVAQGVKE